MAGGLLSTGGVLEGALNGISAERERERARARREREREAVWRGRRGKERESWYCDLPKKNKDVIEYVLIEQGVTLIYILRLGVS